MKLASETLSIGPFPVLAERWIQFCRGYANLSDLYYPPVRALLNSFSVKLVLEDM